MKLPKIVVINGVDYRIEGSTNNTDYIILKKVNTFIEPQKVIVKTKIIEEDAITLNDIFGYYESQEAGSFIPVYIFHYIAVRFKGYSNKEVCEQFNCSKSSVSRSTSMKNIRLRAEEVFTKIKAWKYKQLNK